MIRKISKSDAFEYITLRNQLDQESDFLMREPGEFSPSVCEVADQLEKISQSQNSQIFVAEVDGKLVGYLQAVGGKMQRNRGCAQIAMGVLEEHQNKGFGTSLIEALEDWAVSCKIHRIEMLISSDNVVSQNLFLSLGYEVEGRKKCAAIINGHSVDKLVVAKIFHVVLAYQRKPSEISRQ